MIQNISVEQLHPHPHNPRRDLGDLTELAASIGASGIFQNLTVVPRGAEDEDGYTVVIGHRRLAAARLAGLGEVPCAVTVMDEKDQLATMLLENMQRSDLTVVEQAEGFQLMLDMGESMEDVAQKTGFSQSTVRRRVKLLELPRDALEDAVARGGSLSDYMELDKLKDAARRGRVLEAIGTDNFNHTLKNALEEEAWEDAKAAAVAAFAGWATPVESMAGMAGMVGVDSISQWRPGQVDIEKPEDAGETEYFYLDSGSYLQLLKELPAQAAAAATAPDPEREARQQRKEQLEALAKQAFELRLEFVRGYASKKSHGPVLMEFALRTMMMDGYFSFDEERFCELLGIEIDWKEGITVQALQEAVRFAPERTMLAGAYCNCDDDENEDYADWNGKHTGNEKLDMLYGYLERLGYRMSDEEKALQGGSHEVFLVEGDGT